MKWNLIFAIIFFAIVGTFTLLSFWKVATTFEPDFSIFYQAARDVLTNVSPYTDKHLFTAFNYPIISAVVFIPLTIMPFRFAQLFFTTVNIVSIFLIPYLSFLLIKKPVNKVLYLFTVSLILLSFPTKFTVGMGQVNLISYTLLLFGFIEKQKKRYIRSAMLFILSFIFKPILAFVLVTYFLKREWRFGFGIIGFLLILGMIIPLLVHQPSANSFFLQNILHQSFAGREIYFNQGVLGFIARLTPHLELRKIIYLFTVTIGIIPLLFFIKKLKIIQQFSLLLTFFVLIDPLSWQHHFVFLIFPFIYTYFVMKQIKKHKRILFVLLAGGYFLVSWNIKNPTTITLLKPLFLSHTFLGGVLLLLAQILCIRYTVSHARKNSVFHQRRIRKSQKKL